jgi:hypothetical protein
MQFIRDVAADVCGNMPALYTVLMVLLAVWGVAELVLAVAGLDVVTDPATGLTTVVEVSTP